MALANLNINVNANVSNVVNAMADVKAVTHASMIGSSGSVSDFQKNFTKESAIIQAQSKAIGTEMNKSSVEVSKSAQVSADSISDISAAANTSVAGVKELTKGLDAVGAKVKEAIGPEAAAQMKTTTDRVEEFVGTRVAIAAVGLALGAVAATVATVGYAAYKATGFLSGLISGESYKSENINSLIAINDKVIDLQKNLQMAASDATALNDALARKNVNREDVTGVYEKVQDKVGSASTSEYERLGVKTASPNGDLLDTYTIVQNVKNKLDEYTEGWDRNKAAVALGIGTYAQVNAYLKINQKEIQESKTRLSEYNLLIGPETQKYVDEYQESMRLFKNETALMGEGFKRVYADMVMPIYTTWANTFREGWPSIVNGTRHILAAFVSMGYGVKMVFDIVYDTLEGILKSVGGGLGAIGAAVTFAMKGEFTTAKNVLLSGWNDAAAQIKGIGAKITADATNNLKAMQLAQGKFNKDGSPVGMPGSNKKDGKEWEDAPDPAKPVKALLEGLTDAQKAAQQQIKEWLKTVWDLAATELAAEDFGKDTVKKLGLLTPKPAGFTKNPKFGLGTARLKSAEELEAERAQAAAEAATAAKITAGMSGMETQIKVSKGDEYGAESDRIKTQQEQRLASIMSFAEKERLTNDQKNALMMKSNEVYAAAKKKLDEDTAKQALGSLSNSLGSIGDTLMKGNKEQFEAGKKMAIASATIDMTLGAVRAYTALAGIYAVGPALGALAAAAVVAAGTMNISKIQSQQYEGRALGGPVKAGQTYIVNENRATQGPEYFTPGTSGTITPANKIGGQAISMTQVLQISTGVADTVRAEISRLMPALRAQAVSAVMQAQRSGQMQPA